MSDVVKAEPPNKLVVLEELHRALDFGFEGASDRQRNLLTYLVTEELEGRGDRLKAYGIATEVLGRSADFDPQQDSIVRVEIGRLRQTLERYYLDKGKDAAIVINVPKGQYRPVFDLRAVLPVPTPEPQAALPPAPASGGRFSLAASLIALLVFVGVIAGGFFWRQPAPEPPRRGPVVAVAPFEFHADKEGQAYVGAGLQLELADILSEFQWLSVVPLKDDITPGAQSPEMTHPDFIVRSSLRLIGETLAATALLLDGKNGAVRWTNRYSLPLRAGDVMTMQRDLVTKIGRDVGNPFGIVADITRAERALNERRSDDAFDCQMRAFQYWKTFHSKDYAPAWRCFERLSPQDGADANSIAIRALLTLDPLNRLLTKRTVKEAREAALALASKAYERNNFEFIPRAARYVTAQCVGDVETFTEIARDTIARFPNNPIALADVGARFLNQNIDSQEGLALVMKAREIAPDLTPVDTVAVALDALRRGVYDDRPRLRQVAARTDDAFVLGVELALAAARGDADETRRIKQRFAAIGFPDQQSIGAALESACWSKELHDLVNAKIAIAYK